MDRFGEESTRRGPGGGQAGDRRPDLNGPGRAGDAVDRYLDGEMLPDEACELFDELRNDPARLRELRDVQSIIQQLGKPVPAPDLSRKILNRVHRKRNLLNSTGWRRAKLARYAAALMFLATIGGIFLVERMAPEAARLGDEPQPVHTLARTVERSASALASATQPQQPEPSRPIVLVSNLEQRVAACNRAHAFEVACCDGPSTANGEVFTCMGPPAPQCEHAWELVITECDPVEETPDPMIAIMASEDPLPASPRTPASLPGFADWSGFNVDLSAWPGAASWLDGPQGPARAGGLPQPGNAPARPEKR